MPKTKLTTIEVQSLIAFGEELDRRMKQAKMGFAELSRLTDGAMSTGYISDIVRAGRGDSQKYFRLGREKVVILAKALDWDEDEALDFAGYKSADAAGYSKNSDADTIEEALDDAQFFDRKGLSEHDRTELRPLLEVADREIERMLSRHPGTQLSKAPTSKVRSLPKKRDKIDEAIDAALAYGGGPISEADRKKIREILENQSDDESS